MQPTSVPPSSPAHTIRPTISAAPLDDGAVLLDLETKFFYAVNASGWSILQLFESGASLHDVEARTRTWGAPEGDGVAAFVQQLHQFDLLEPANGSGETGEVSWTGPWATPTIERQAEPLHNVMVSAFDPSIPLAE
jgi:hypothetical protein